MAFLYIAGSDDLDMTFNYEAYVAGDPFVDNSLGHNAHSFPTAVNSCTMDGPDEITL